MTIPSTFMSPESTIPVVDKTRVATTGFDPSVPQKLTADMFSNSGGRIPESAASKIKAEMGGIYSDQLDHKISLELAGSNDKSNLQIEPLVAGTKNTATDPLENALTQQVIKGQISLRDAQRKIAQAKGFTIKEDAAKNNIFQTGLLNAPSTLPTLSELQIDPLSLKADPHKAIGDAWNSIKDTVLKEADSIKRVFTEPTIAGKIGAGLSSAAGVVNTALSPISALFAGANDIPILGSVSRLLSLPFEVIGDSGKPIATKIVNTLPISQQSKDKLVDGVSEIVSLAGQLALGVGGEKITSSLKGKYSSADVKTIVEKAQEINDNKAKSDSIPISDKPLPDAKSIETPEDKAARQKGAIDPTILTKAKDAVIRAVEPAKIVEEKSPGAYANTMRAIHTPEAERLSFDNTQSKEFDAKFSDLEKYFSKFSDKELNDFNLTRGTAEREEAIRAQAQARREVNPQLDTPQIRAAVKETSDYVYNLAKSHGLDLTYFEDYFYGAYKDKAAVNNFLDYWKSTDRYIKEKTIPTIADAAQFGLELKDPNPITNIKHELQDVAHRVGMKTLVDKELTSDHGLVIKSEDATPLQRREWRKIEDPTFNGTLADPDFAKLVNNLISTNKVSSNRFLKGLRQSAFVAQQIKFLGSLYHMQNELRAAVASETGGMLNPKGWKDYAKSFKSIDETDPAYKNYVNLGGGHRYSIESQAEGQINKAIDTTFGRNSTLGGILKVPGKIINSKYIPASPGFVHWMFDSFIPKLKFQKFTEDVAAAEKNAGRTITDAEKIGIIKRNQNFYGEMNERLFGRSGTVTSFMRLVFSAPGYGEGNFRALAKATAGDAKSASFIVNSLVTTAIAATIGTKITTGQWPSAPKTSNDIRDLFKLKTNQKDGNGDQVMFDMMSYDKDYWSIYGNLLTGQGEKIPTELSSRISGMVSGPFSALTDLSMIFKGDMIYDFSNNPIYSKTDPLAIKIQKFTQYEITQGQPISASTAQQGSQKGLSTTAAIAEGIIGIRPTNSENVKDAKKLEGDLRSMKNDKTTMQIKLNKLAGENPAEAARQAKSFNDSQKAKLQRMLKGQGVTSVSKSDFLIQNLRTKPPKNGTNVNDFLNPPKP